MPLRQTKGEGTWMRARGTTNETHTQPAVLHLQRHDCDVTGCRTNYRFCSRRTQLSLSMYHTLRILLLLFTTIWLDIHIKCGEFSLKVTIVQSHNTMAIELMARWLKPFLYLQDYERIWTNECLWWPPKAVTWVIKLISISYAPVCAWKKGKKDALGEISLCHHILSCVLH